MLKKRKIPHTYAIIFYIIIIAAVLTWVIPGGEYIETVNVEDGIEKTEVEFRYTDNQPQTWQVFAAIFK